MNRFLEDGRLRLDNLSELGLRRHMLQFHLQGEGIAIASQWLSMLPYLATFLVLLLISRDAGLIKIDMPASLGKPFFPNS